MSDEEKNKSSNSLSVSKEFGDLIAKTGETLNSVAISSLGAATGATTGAGLFTAIGFCAAGPAGGAIGFMCGFVGGLIGGGAAAYQTSEWAFGQLSKSERKKG